MYSNPLYFSLGKTRFFFLAPFEDNIDFGFDFGANLPPCWPPKSKIFRNYGLPRDLQNLIFFRIDFLSILGPSWPPTWTHLGGKDDSNFKKNESKKLLWWLPGAILDTNLLLNTVQEAFGLDFWGVRGPFSMIFG